MPEIQGVGNPRQEIQDWTRVASPLGVRCWETGQVRAERPNRYWQCNKSEKGLESGEQPEAKSISTVEVKAHTMKLSNRAPWAAETPEENEIVRQNPSSAEG